ncbi:hypothetical protein CQ011_14540 [Arthrobacter sp. MYb213]|nr:hypothetical protein CQ011_14540 [Arthrobacter sp. MYb213]
MRQVPADQWYLTGMSTVRGAEDGIPGDTARTAGQLDKLCRGRVVFFPLFARCSGSLSSLDALFSTSRLISWGRLALGEGIG